jgi:hypothetical protein
MQIRIVHVETVGAGGGLDENSMPVKVPLQETGTVPVNCVQSGNVGLNSSCTALLFISFLEVINLIRIDCGFCTVQPLAITVTTG